MRVLERAPQRRSVPSVRIANFGLIGVVAGLTQLALVRVLVDFGWIPFLANASAFLLAAQLNFLLNSTITWRDRATQPHQWRTFMSSIAATGLLNLAVFAIAHGQGAPPVIASACGIMVASTINYLVADRITFADARDGGAAAGHSTRGAMTGD